MKHATKQELIGKCITVISSSNRNLIGIRGIIMDETRNTFVLKTTRQKSNKTLLGADMDNRKISHTIRLPKSHIIFTVEMQGKRIEMDGKALIGRSEERIKR